MSVDELAELEEKVRRGEFRPTDTMYLNLLRKKADFEEAKKIVKDRLDIPTLYTYIASLEKRVEALEKLVESMRRMML